MYTGFRKKIPIKLRTFFKSFTVSIIMLAVICLVIYFVGKAATRTKAVGYGDNRPALGGKQENGVTTLYFFDYKIDFSIDIQRLH